MYNYNFGKLFIVLGMFGFAVWGLWELIDWLFITDVIKSKTLINPDIELIINDNNVDTIYVYKN